MVFVTAMDDTADTFLIVVAGSLRAALPRADAAEVLPLPALHRPPSSPKALEGFMNLGGEAVAVLSLARLLAPQSERAEPDLYAHLVRLKAPRQDIALLVDRVIAADAAAQASSPIAPDESLNGVLSSNLLVDGELIPRLDVSRVLGAYEQARLEEMTRQAQARLADWEAEAP